MSSTQLDLTSFESDCTSDEDSSDEYSDTVPQTSDELITSAKSYARTLDVDVDIDEITWEVSHRAKRQAGVCIYNRNTEEITIRLTWDAFETLGWEDTKGTIRHELIHAEDYRSRGKSGHGSAFVARANELDAPINCEKFTDAPYHILCASCEAFVARRYRASKTVKHPNRYSSNGCNCEPGLKVVHNESGDSWTDFSEYTQMRD